MTLTLPLRARTSVRAGVRRTVRRHGRRQRRRAVLDRKARVLFGHQVRVTGVSGRLLAGRWETPRFRCSHERRRHPNGPSQLLRTDQHGRFEYLSGRPRPRSCASSIKAPLRPFRRSARYAVGPGNSTIGTHPRRVVNGQTVTFVGRLRSLPVPIRGKLDRVAGPALGTGRLPDCPVRHEGGLASPLWVPNSPAPTPTRRAPPPPPPPPNGHGHGHGLLRILADRLLHSSSTSSPRAGPATSAATSSSSRIRADGSTRSLRRRLSLLWWRPSTGS